MKKIKLIKELFSILLVFFTTSIYAQSKTLINKNTPFEAKIYLNNENFYLDFKGKKIKLADYEVSGEASGKQTYDIKDFDFDGLDDVAIRITGSMGAVNIHYEIYLAKDNYHKLSLKKNHDYISDTISNYELFPKYKTLLSEYKSGARHFTEIYIPNTNNKLKHYVIYENYSEDDLCFVRFIKSKPVNKILSCQALIKKHKEKPMFAKVNKKSYLYNKQSLSNNDKTKSYLIKGDIVELISGEYSENYLVKFKGKKIITKWINPENLDILPSNK